MAIQTKGKLNQLEAALPEGLLVDSAWLKRHGYSGALRSQYVTSGWLVQPARRVYYRRPRGVLTWQQVVISLQTLLRYPLTVGGRTALELQGYAHYLSQDLREVHLYGAKRPPRWLHTLNLEVRFFYHNGSKLFRDHPLQPVAEVNLWKTENLAKTLGDTFTVQSWGHWNWPLILSTPERAVLELLDELPAHETFHQVDKLMDGLASLSPHRLQNLLMSCRSVKVKRLFFFFADRHQHAWLKRLDKQAVDLGKGKRMLVKGGKLDPAYQITVPQDLNGVQ